MQPGTHLGPYEVRSALGAGGMGEVYRARDSRLDRDVAIKVLPAAFAQDPARVARFEREAKAIAALSHPNVLAIFDTGLHDGHPYLVSELLDGDTLAARLAAGPLPFRKAIEWGSQIARGLAAAHGKGVVHRDLKPDNVFITADGHAKILDFGLAKAADIPAAGAMSGAAVATMTATPITDAGTVMGTAGYMSPEQVRGEPVDARSDLFSFGAVLYEMLTGTRAFRGDTTAETMTAILREDPPEVSTARSQLSPALDRIVHHCLEKQPGERFQTARDVAFALEALSGSGSVSAASVPMAAARRRVTPERMAWSALTLALIAALGVVGMRSATPVSAPLYVATLVMPEGVKLSTSAPLATKIALSPDGRHLAFVGSPPGRPSQLWLQSLDGPAAVPVQGSDGAEGPFWSPDSRFVAFRQGANLFRVTATGGSLMTVASITAPGGKSGSNGTWNASDTMLVDNQEILQNGAAEVLWRIARPGAAPSVALTSDRGIHIGLPTFLPDGQRFIFASGSAAFPDSGLYLGRLGSSDRTLLVRHTVTQDNLNAFYAAGYLLSVHNRSLLARPFDPVHGVLGNESTTIAGPVDGVVPGAATFSVSQTGVLVYQTSTAGSGSQPTWHDRTGRVLSTLGDAADYSNLELSPDGSQLLVGVLDPNLRTRDIWVVDVTRGVRTRVTFDPSDERSAVWMPDGKAIIYSTRGLELYTKTIGGTAETPVIVNHLSKDPRGVSPDGKLLLFRQSGQSKGNDLWTRALLGDAPPTPFLATTYNETNGVISPDGRWVAYESDESGRAEIYVTGFPSAAGKWQISVAGGSMARWRRDGREMFYLAPDNTLMSVQISASAGQFTVAAPVALFHTTAMTGPAYPYDVSADGQRFIIADTRASTLPPSLTIVFNWPELLKQSSK